MLVLPSWRKTLMARFRRLAMARGRVPVRILESSLAEGAVAHVVQEVFDAPVASDPCGEFGAGGIEDAQARDQVDALDGQFARAHLPSPAHDLDRLAGAGVVEVGERGAFEAADFVTVVGPLTSAVPERDVPPGQLCDLGIQAGMVLLDDSHVVGTTADQIGAVIALGMQGIGGQYGILQVEWAQQRLEGGDFVALGSDLTLGQDHAVVVRRGQQLDRSGGLGARAADHLAVDGDQSPHRPLRLRLGHERRSGLQICAKCRVQRVAVDAVQQTAHGGGVRHGPETGERVDGETEGTQDLLRSVRDPLTDGKERACPRQYRCGSRAQQRSRWIPPPADIAGIRHPT